MPNSALDPGFIVLHGDRLEDLRDALLAWLRTHPLDPLENEVFLVQSNGIAEWLQWSLAEQEGICAALRVQLPGRFLWETYQRVLGAGVVRSRSPLDKGPLTWRILRCLPALLADRDRYAVLVRYLGQAGRQQDERRWQVAEVLADLFDQYQVYRGDWLADWAAGRDTLRDSLGRPHDLPADQQWQAALWLAILMDIQSDADQQDTPAGRAELHARFLESLRIGKTAQALPRRVVLFGAATLPAQSLEALAALGQHIQVLLAMPNPCRYYWGDIISGRELLSRERRRQGARPGTAFANLPLSALHGETNVLLAQWGRQGRDFLHLLDSYDQSQDNAVIRDWPRIDLFSEDHGTSLLRQLQTHIRDLQPLQPDQVQALREADRSVEFHLAHSPLREVQVLHDQLLDRFLRSDLQPRDVIVMVPDIRVFAPFIRATFDPYPADDPRRIPYHVIDLQARDASPLLIALEGLLHLPQRRARQSEIRGLLHCAALQQRFGLEIADLPQLESWLDGAGWRWGLSGQHRADLDLPQCGTQNTGEFALHRLWLGYSNGADSHLDSPLGPIEASDGVGGLDARLLGPLQELWDRLEHWRQRLQLAQNPTTWAQCGRELLEDFFLATDSSEEQTLQEANAALERWLGDCRIAAFDDPLSLTVFRESWLDRLGGPALQQRFLGGGVTFCTLLPMRAVPFPLVCLLGMNEADYPRRRAKSDFDLLASPGMSRPGDRSRRDDDHYLMLEAVLSARQGLYISWAGRDMQRNEFQEPSLLVSQLRDAIASAWPSTDGAGDVLARITHQHPLQPFSPRYQDPHSGLHTWAREWFPPGVAPTQQDTALPAPDPLRSRRLTDLLGFLRDPCQAFFGQRLRIHLGRAAQPDQDDEPFVLDGLERYGLMAELLMEGHGADTGAQSLDERLGAQQRRGAYPMGAVGAQIREALGQDLAPLLEAWRQLRKTWVPARRRHALFDDTDPLPMDDWLDGVYEDAQGRNAILQRLPSRLHLSEKAPGENPDLAAEKLLGLWLRQILAASQGVPCQGIVLALDGVIFAETAPTQALARATRHQLLALWAEGLSTPLPVGIKTALAFLREGNSEKALNKAQAAYEGGRYHAGEGERSPALSRAYPDFSALATARCGPQGLGFSDYADALYRPLLDWLHTLRQDALS